MKYVVVLGILFLLTAFFSGWLNTYLWRIGAKEMTLREVSIISVILFLIYLVL